MTRGSFGTGWASRRNALIAAPLTLLVAGAAVVVVRSDPGPALTLTAEVQEGSVSKMITAKGTVSPAKSANLSFKAANSIKSVDVKVGDKVKKGQKLGEQDNGGARFALLVAEGTLAAQQAALDLVLNDVNPNGLAKIAARAEDAAEQAKRNIEIRQEADTKVYHRLQGLVQFDAAAVRSARAALDRDGCTSTGGTKPQQFPVPAANVAPVPGPGTQSLTPFGVPARPVYPADPNQTTSPQATCKADYAALQATRKTYFSDRTAFINAAQNIRVNRGVLRSTYRASLQALDTARNAANIARVNRPNQILAAQANVANAQSNVGGAQSTVKNSYVYAPVDGTVTGISGTTGEFSAGGNNLTPTTPVVAGGTARIPTVGPLATADRSNPGNTNGGVTSSNPTGGAFIQISDLNTFQVVAAYPESDVAQLTPGALSKVTFDSLPGKEYDGTVTAFNPSGIAGPEGKTLYYATVLLNSAPAELKAGMAANVSVVVATVQNKAYVVPTSAVQGNGDDTYVYMPSPDGSPRKQPFTRGKVGDDNSEVISGLKPGDTVLMPETGRMPRPSEDSVAPPQAQGDTVTMIIPEPKPVAAAAPAPMMPIPGLPADPALGAGDPTLGTDPTLDGPADYGNADPGAAPAAPAGTDLGTGTSVTPGN